MLKRIIYNCKEDFSSKNVLYNILKEALYEFPVAEVKTLLPEDTQDFLIHAITICPHGVYRMIPEMPDVVETSNSLSIIATDANTITVSCLGRSSVESRKEELIFLNIFIFLTERCGCASLFLPSRLPLSRGQIRAF